MIEHDTKTRGLPPGAFPPTHWSKLAAAKGDVTAERQAALNFLIERYWKPVYCYVRRRGTSDDEAKDVVQEFFCAALTKELFAKADAKRGRFRNFLLKSLQHFLANVQRAAHAKKRHPTQGFVCAHELATSGGLFVVPADTKTPEDAFHRAWGCELVRCVLRTLEDECRATGKVSHYELLRRRIIEPALDNAEPPPLRDLAQSLGLTEKEAANQLLTARRAYQRLLRDEIRIFAASEEEVAEEIQDLFRFLAGG